MRAVSATTVVRSTATDLQGCCTFRSCATDVRQEGTTPDEGKPAA
jgi:hypothetical protein